MLQPLVMITFISEMQQYRGVSGWLVVMAVLQLAVAHMDGWDNPTHTGSNMGLRILKRSGQMQSIDINHKKDPELVQMLRRIIPKLDLVSYQNKKLLILIFIFTISYYVQDSIQIPATLHHYFGIDKHSGEPT